jgi:hypothetical protein
MNPHKVVPLVTAIGITCLFLALGLSIHRANQAARSTPKVSPMTRLRHVESLAVPHIGHVAIVRDVETGREFLTSNQGGIVEIKPKDAP